MKFKVIKKICVKGLNVVKVPDGAFTNMAFYNNGNHTIFISSYAADVKDGWPIAPGGIPFTINLLGNEEEVFIHSDFDEHDVRILFD